MRWVAAPTRQLHPAAQCFRGAGYRIEPTPMKEVGDDATACFHAFKAGRTYQVCETIEASDGQRWSDVSAWYWSALMSQSGIYWWSRVTVEEVGRHTPATAPRIFQGE
jgi:hypothetical protein